MEHRREMLEKYRTLWQLVKYGVIGVLATLVQLTVFYSLASTLLKCLKPDDWVVKLLGMSAVEISDSSRGLNFAICTTIGFVISNFFCWVMNRLFVFRPGKFSWYVELALFYAASTLAAVISIALSWLSINSFGLMTTLAVFIEIVVSFLCNYFIRKFVIFKG